MPKTKSQTTKTNFTGIDAEDFAIIKTLLDAQRVYREGDHISEQSYVEQAYRKGRRHGRLAVSRVVEYYFGQGHEQGEKEALRTAAAGLREQAAVLERMAASLGKVSDLVA